jgi:hypothetical protein
MPFTPNPNFRKKLTSMINEELTIQDVLAKHKNSQVIHKTANGYVLLNPFDQIVKITNDKIEYENALKFIERPSKLFVKYFSAKELGDGMYELIMDKLDPLNDKEWDIVDLIQQTLGAQSYMLNQQRRTAFVMELKQNPEFYEEFAKLEEVVAFMTLLKKMYEEAQARGITLYDLRAQNIGKTKNGNYVHFDIGRG